MPRLKSDISRRDFLGGVALSTAAGALAPSALASSAFAAGPAPAAYPPALTGLRGAHKGAFETAHALAWNGKHWARPEKQTDGLYDLVVIGAGLSGLAAAERYRAKAGRPVKILILDNHDDFGGHAKRNEFTVDGKLLIGYGGSQSIDGPGGYSPQAKEILALLGVDTQKFYGFFDREFYERRGMRPVIHFDAKTYGASALTDIPFGYWAEAPSHSAVTSALKGAPLSKEGKAALKRLVLKSEDYLPGKSRDEKIAYLRGASYEQFLREKAHAPEDFITLLNKTPYGIWGVGWDALSALEASRWGMPGTAGLGVADGDDNEHDSGEPYIFHFPDGNASLARLLVRKLIPAAIPGSTMEDIVLARADYSRLDDPASDVRIRLNSTAVDLRHSPSGKSVDVVYVENGEPRRVRGRHAIMAGYMAMTPYIASELPAEQIEAIRFFTKVPLVYGNVALRNWRAFEKARAHRIYAPNGFYESMALDFPVSIGDYKFAASSDEPILLHLQHVPTARGQAEKVQHRAGRAELYNTTYDAFESALVDQLTDMLGAYGFDAERDIAGITINRWPHGYAYEYNDLYDDPSWSPAKGPHLAARAPLRRISFANSDTSALAYVNGAFDAAVRAVDEQLGVADA